MSSNVDLTTIVVPLLVPVTTALLGAAGIVIRDKRLARDKRLVRERAISSANAEIAFASEWWKAHELLGTEATPETIEKMRSWLGEAEAKVVGTTHLTVPHDRRVTIRRLLLLYKMRRRSARILRVIFYIWAAYLIGGAVQLSAALATRNSQAESNGLALLAGSAILVLIFGFWAAALERAAESKESGRPNVGAVPSDPSVVRTPSGRAGGQGAGTRDLVGMASPPAMATERSPQLPTA